MRIEHHGDEHTITCTTTELVAIKAALQLVSQFKERRTLQAWERFKEAERVAASQPADQGNLLARPGFAPVAQG